MLDVLDPLEAGHDVERAARDGEGRLHVRLGRVHPGPTSRTGVEVEASDAASASGEGEREQARAAGHVEDPSREVTLEQAQRGVADGGG